MARSPGVPCYWTGCPAIVPKGMRYCPTHKTQGYKKDQQFRLPAHQRGYDKRWHNFRNFFLRRNPICVHCMSIATIVDHIVPVTGKDDPNFYRYDNHQAMCRICHDRKHKRDKSDEGSA